jgi:hypothetical protein
MVVQTRRVQAAISENRTWFITLGDAATKRA